MDHEHARTQLTFWSVLAVSKSQSSLHGPCNQLGWGIQALTTPSRSRVADLHKTSSTRTLTRTQPTWPPFKHCSPPIRKLPQVTSSGQQLCLSGRSGLFRLTLWSHSVEREVTLADIVLGLLHRSGGVSAAVPLGERAPRESRHSFGHRPEAISQLALEPTFYIRGIQKRSRGLVFMRLHRDRLF